MMLFIKNKKKLSDLNSFLLMGFAFSLPLSVALSNVIMGFIVFFWLLRKDFNNDWNLLKENNVVKAILLFVLIHFIALIWTNDFILGLYILKKELKFLLIPIFMLFIKKEHIKYYIASFLLAMSISEIFSYLIWFEIIEPFKSASVLNPTPFMSHISYNPFLVIASYLLCYSFLFNKNMEKKLKFLYLLFIITISINVFITGGRAGQVMYFFMLIILVFQYFEKQFIKSFFMSLFLVISIFLLAYNTSTIFNKRVNLTYHNVTNFEKNKNTSVGLRMLFTLNSIDIIKNNLLIGVGTGAFGSEYKKINKINSPTSPNTTNPHNMYIFVFTQFGIIGFLIFMSIFYYQIKHAISSSNNFIAKTGLVLPLLFLLIMFSESYLLGHFTTMLFVFFSAILYKNYENE